MPLLAHDGLRIAEVAGAYSRSKCSEGQAGTPAQRFSRCYVLDLFGHFKNILSHGWQYIIFTA